MREYESISSLKLFNDCPRCYWLNYVAGLVEESSPAQVLGSEVHKAIADYHLGKEPEISGEGNKLYQVYRENTSELKLDALEKEFEVDVEHLATGEVLPVKFKGFIDGIDTKTGWIFEHKTSSNYWTYEDVATNIQATGYAYAYFKLYGDLPKGIRFNILKKNKGKCKFQALETYRTYEDLIYFFNWFKDTIERIKTSDFAPKQTRFNTHHRLCPHSRKDNKGVK